MPPSLDGIFCLDLLLRMWPLVPKMYLAMAAAVKNDYVHVVITTLPTSRTIFQYLDYLCGGKFLVTVVVPPRCSEEFRSQLRAFSCVTDIRSYPFRYAGNLMAIRRWAERNFTPPFVLSDDDPGSSYKNSDEVRWAPPHIISPDNTVTCGAHRNKLSAEQFSWLVNVAIYFGVLGNVCYVGFNGSAQPTARCVHDGSCGSGRKRSSFGAYGYFPFAYDLAITQFQIVLRPVRRFIPQGLRRIHQEYATSCAEAIGGGHGGTMAILSVVMHFGVRRPKDAEMDINWLSAYYPGVVERGNAAAGRSRDEKTGCIVHFSTRRTYNTPRHTRPSWEDLK